MTETPATAATSTPKRSHKKKAGAPSAARIPHPLLIWMPDGGSGLMGMRSRTVFIRITPLGGVYKITPTFPLPRGARVIDDTAGDIETAKAKAERFFTLWLERVGLTVDPDILVPGAR